MQSYKYTMWRLNNTFALALIILSTIFLTGCLPQFTKSKPVKVPPEFSKELDSISGSYEIEYKKYSMNQGDTIWKISQNFGVSPESIINLNHINDVKNLKTGQILLIPVPKTSHVTSKSISNQTIPAPVTIANKTSAVSSYGFIWPLNNKVFVGFGDYKNGYVNTGLDIEANLNDDVLAVKDGTVIVVLNNSGGGGKVVVIKHSNYEHSWYAHNSRIFVRKGMQVKRGQVIAKAGQSGDALRPELHFKLFKKDKAVNPQSYLSYLPY